MTEIVLDIEVVAPGWDEIDQPTQDYLVKRMRGQVIRDGLDPDQEPLDELAAERTALELGLAQVVAIGMWSLPAERGAVLLLTPTLEFLPDVTGTPSMETSLAIDGAKTRCFHTECDLLAAFWAGLKKLDPERTITANGRSFDGPVLMVRSAINGVQCGRDLVPYRYDLSQHCDLLDVLTFWGGTRQMYSVDWWLRRFGIESSKAAGITGADVARLFRSGDYQAIGEYVLRDVQAEAKLYQALAGTMLHLFRGGPRVTPQLSMRMEA